MTVEQEVQREVFRLLLRELLDCLADPTRRNEYVAAEDRHRLGEEWLARFDAASETPPMPPLMSFAVRRPYCHPERFIVIARSPGEAIELAHKCYGYASGTTAISV